MENEDRKILINELTKEYFEGMEKGEFPKWKPKTIVKYIVALLQANICQPEHHLDRLCSLYQISITKKLAHRSFWIALISATLSIVSIGFVVYGIIAEKKNLEIKKRHLEIDEGRWKMERSNDIKNMFKGHGILEGHINKKRIGEPGEKKSWSYWALSTVELS